MQILIQDLKYALRQAARNPGFAAAVVLSLALGIGVNSAIFSAVNGILLRPLPYTHGDRLVRLGYRPERSVSFSVSELQDYRRQNKTFAGVEEYHTMTFTLVGVGDPDQVKAGVVSSSFFDTFGVKPLLGRTFAPGEDDPDRPPVVILTYRYWQHHFGGDPKVLGKGFLLDNRPVTVVGVLPPMPDYPEKNDLFVSVGGCIFRSKPSTIHDRSVLLVSLFGVMKPGVTLERAQADVSTINGRLRREHAEAYAKGGDSSIPVVPIMEEITGSFRPILFILLGTVGLVLLITCVNVANLILSRLIRRERELVVRAAIGAGRRRLIRQLLTESVLLALAGGALGMLLAAASVRLLVAFSGSFTVRAPEIAIDSRVLLFTLAVSVATGLLFGVMPALQASRRDLTSALKEGGEHGTVGGSRRRFRSFVVVAQVAISFILLVGAGLTVRSLIKLYQVDPGFAPDKVLTAFIELPYIKYQGRPVMRSFFETLLERLNAHPGVVAAALASDVPLQDDMFTPAIEIEGQPRMPGEPELRANFDIATEGFFKVMGIPLKQGRDFNRNDGPEAPPVIIVNEAFVHRYWPTEDPLGKRVQVRFMGGNEWRSVVGVVADVKQKDLETEVAPGFYLPFPQRPGTGMLLFMRTKGEAASMVPDLLSVVHSLDPELPVAEIQTLEQVRSKSIAPTRLTAALISLFAVLAFIITAIGTSGVVGSLVNERWKEIGIRTALGAERKDVLGLVMRQGMTLVLAGLLLGVLGSLLLTKLLSSLLFGVEPTDVLTFVVVSLMLILVVGLACFVPARRAAKVDPIVVLR
jgi:predicted permease